MREKKQNDPALTANDVAANGDRQPAWYTLSTEEVCTQLRSHLAHRLTDEEAASRLAQYGPNRLVMSIGRSALEIFAAQFKSLIVVLLLLAAGVAFSLGEIVEAGAILMVIVFNSIIGFITEWRAELALAALQKQIVAVAHVIRSGVYYPRVFAHDRRSTAA